MVNVFDLSKEFCMMNILLGILNNSCPFFHTSLFFINLKLKFLDILYIWIIGFVSFRKWYPNFQNFKLFASFIWVYIIICLHLNIIAITVNGLYLPLLLRFQSHLYPNLCNSCTWLFNLVYIHLYIHYIITYRYLGHVQQLGDVIQ